MSVELIAVCFKKQFENHADRDVMLALCDHANDEGICWPSRAHIAWKMDRHPETVKQCMKKFREQGLIEVRREANNDLSKSPVLRVLPYKLPDKKPRVAEPDRGASDPPGAGVSDPPARGVGDSPKPSGEPPSNYEDKSSSRKANEQGGKPIVIPVDKYTTDRMYNAYKMAGYPRWTQDEYGYHLGRVQLMLKENDPTDEELDQLPSEFLKLYTNWNPKADAIDTLREMRRNKVRHLRPVSSEPTRPKKRVIS